MNWTGFTAAFAAGLMGFGHCAGMCGGLSAALCMGRKGLRGLLFVSFYQVGRIATYTGLGFAGGSLGAAVLTSPTFSQFAKVLLVASDFLVIGLGLAGLGIIPGIGSPFSSSAGTAGFFAGIVRKTQKAPLPIAAVLLGLAMGFLPCGLLYPWLISAALTAVPSDGAMTMLGFGLGTVPALMVVGIAADRVRALPGMFLKTAWLIVIGMGVFNLYRHIVNWKLIGTCCGP